MVYKEFVTRLAQAKAMMPVYVFTGAESFLKAQGLKMLIERFSPDAPIGTPLTLRTTESPLEIKRFNQRSFDEAAFWNEVYLVPFFNSRRLIVLEADDAAFPNKIIGPLDEFLAQKSTGSASLALVIPEVSGRGDGGKILRLGEKHGWLVDCPRIQEYDLPRWLTMQLKQSGKTISRDNAKILLESTGNDLAKIDAAITKLALYARNQAEITTEILQNLVERNADYDIKELGASIVNHNPGKALTVLDRLIAEGEAPPRILGYLRWYLGRNQDQKLLRQRYKQLLDTDLAIKTGRLPEEMAMQMMVVTMAARK